MATIINKVKEKRKEQHLTQEDLANKVGVTRKTILSLEKGSYIPSLLLAMDLASALNIKIDQLFFKGE
ncbi:helix-turn-helix transcriptional regulator [Carnobacterium inhibens]|uniref:helix-turn-helix transcriptional regulator n=1 Tax=Carnobacterium inhibens TaxID=147709 RepID=UPI002559B80F|nr:helix-turn-helix transcriptional regulator [Carnobacterium inhibens]